MSNGYTFNFNPMDKSSEIIAHVVSGSDKGKNIYLNKTNESDIEVNKLELFYDYANETKLRITQKKLDQLINYLETDTEPDELDLRMIYNQFLINLKKSNEIKLKDSELEVVPYQGDKEDIKIEHIFLGACSGSGKTTWIANYAKYFNKLYPKSPIYYISQKPLKDEKAFAKIKNVEPIPVKENDLDDIIDEGSYEYFISKTGESLVIFDDFDALPNKLEKKLDTILHSILQVGRSKRIFCIVSKHTLNAGVKTKLIWSESNKIVLFTNGLSRYSIVYACKHYLGLDNKTIDKILNHKDRWIMIHNHLPKYFISPHSLYFL